MFPGARYKFLGEFRATNSVFLDMPGLDLPDGQLAMTTPMLRERIMASHATKTWLSDYRRWARSSSEGQEPARPTAALSEYSAKPKFNSYENQVGAVCGLFGEAAQGDLVVIPSRLQERDILIGEFLDGPATRVMSSRIESFAGVPTPVRRVRWFDRVNELRLPAEMSEVLRIPVPFSLLSRSLSQPISETTFRTYYGPNEYVAGIRIGSEDFTTQNNLDLALLAKYSAVLLSLLESLDLRDQIRDYVEAVAAAEFQPSISLNINSPGFGFFALRRLSHSPSRLFLR